ncbi:MAG: hypothetical protein ABW321_34285 [Polyangiales bacterium]
MTFSAINTRRREALQLRAAAGLRTSAWWPWLASSLLLALGIRRYYPFLADDTLISLRYAQRLLRGNGLTWDNYHPVEGYTNLLWTLSAAALGALGVDLVLAARILCTGSALGCLAILAAAQSDKRSALAPWLACGFFALSGDVQVWALGGLEQTQLACLLLASIVSQLRFHSSGERRWLALSVLASFLLVFTRPDSVLFCGASCLAASWLPTGATSVVWARRQAAFGWLCAATVLGLLLKYGFSRTYYGEWLPNTAYIKLALTKTRFLRGLTQYGRFLAHSAALWLTLGWYLAVAQRRRVLQPRPLAYVGLAFLTWSAYVVSIGGDIFPADRHCVVLSALGCLAFVVGAKPLPLREVRGVTFGAAVLLPAHVYVQASYDENIRAQSERWEFPCADFASALGQAFRDEQPLLAVYAAGCMGYYSELPALDVFGLNDWQIARNPPPDLGENEIGHEFGSGPADADYVWRRNPSFIITHIGDRNASFFDDLAETGYPAAPGLGARYREVAFEHGERRSWVLFSRDSTLAAATSGDAGTFSFQPIALEPLRERKPAQLRLVGSDAVYVLREPSRLSARGLPPGRYQLALGADGGDVEVQCDGGAGATLEVTRGEGGCTLTPRAGVSPAVVHTLRFVPQR